MSKIPDPASLTLAQQVDAACDRFEAAWLSGTKPNLEDFLVGVEQANIPQFVRSLLKIEVELLEKEGQQVTAESFAERFETYADIVAEVLHSHAAKSEKPGTKTRQVRTFSLRDASIDTSFITGTVSSKNPKDFPKQLGRFKILKVLGEGAFGTVYHAHDPHLDREVALKVPRAGVLETQEDIERFLQEARAVADLRHAHVCPIYDFGRIDDDYFIVMAYIAGKPLSSVITGRKKIAERKIAAVIRKIALALDAAHKLGVVHRDLKPANIMIDKQGEPVVMDFGLARRITGDAAQITHSGAVLGTPAYMPPEQAKGDSNAVGPRSDVYSLGVILYELLCGQRPFGGSVAEVFASILHREPSPPSAYRSGVNPRLEAICLKAIAKQPKDRHDSMAALAETLTDYLRSKRETDSNENSGVLKSLADSPSSAVIPNAQNKNNASSDSSLTGFNPYHKWLGIPPEEQPPNHYRLLSLITFEDDFDVIEAAVERQMGYLHQIATGPHLEQAQQILNELAAAKLCLLNPEQKATYDAKLRKELAVDSEEYDEYAVEVETPYDDTEFDDLPPLLNLRTKAVEKSSWWENPYRLIPAVGGATLVILLGAVMIIKMNRSPAAPDPNFVAVASPTNEASPNGADSEPEDDINPDLDPSVVNSLNEDPLDKVIRKTDSRHLVPVYDASSGQLPQAGGWRFQGDEVVTIQSGTLLHDAQGGKEGFWTATIPIDDSPGESGVFMETTARILEEDRTSTVAGLTLLDIRSDNLAAVLVAQEDRVFVRDAEGNTIDALDMDTTDGLHTYRLELADETFWLFVDGELKRHNSAARLRPDQAHGNPTDELVATFGDTFGAEYASRTEYRDVSFGNLSDEGGPTVLRDRNNFEAPLYPANLNPLVRIYDASERKLPDSSGWIYHRPEAGSSEAEISSSGLLAHNAEMKSYSYWFSTLPVSRAPKDAGMFMEVTAKLNSEKHTNQRRGYCLMGLAEITPTNVRGFSVSLWENQIFVIDSNDESIQGAKIDWDTTDHFHTYRAEVKGDRFWVYIDGQEKLSGHVPTYPTRPEVTDLLPDDQKTLPRLWAKFGDGSSMSQSVTETKSVTFGSLSALGGPTALRQPTDYDDLLTGYWQDLIRDQDDIPDWDGVIISDGEFESPTNSDYAYKIGSRPYRDLILRANIFKKSGWRAGINLRSDRIGHYGLWMVNGRGFGVGVHKPKWVVLQDPVRVDNLRDGFEWTCVMIGDHLTSYVDGKKILDVHDTSHSVGFPRVHIRDSVFRNLQIMDLTRGPFRPREDETDRVSTITRPVLPDPRIAAPSELAQTSQPPQDNEDHNSTSRRHRSSTTREN